MESGQNLKALNAAIQSKQWIKANSIVESLDQVNDASPYILPLARHFESSGFLTDPDYIIQRLVVCQMTETIGELHLAEKYYCLLKTPQAAVDMYVRANNWEKALAVAQTFMSRDQVANFNLTQSKELEKRGALPKKHANLRRFMERGGSSLCYDERTRPGNQHVQGAATL